jgi:hypothetical protein
MNTLQTTALKPLDELLYDEAWEAVLIWVARLQNFRFYKDSFFFVEGGRRFRELGDSIVRLRRKKNLAIVTSQIEVTDVPLRHFAECIRLATLLHKPHQLGKTLRAAYRSEIEYSVEMAEDFRDQLDALN